MAMDKQTVKNYKLDIEAMLKCLDKVIEKKKMAMERYAASKTWQMIFEKENDLLSIAIQCKENMSFIYDVLDNKLLDSEIITSNIANGFYTPREIVFLSEIGEYRTETIKIKKDFDTLGWMARVKGSTERELFFRDCIEKLKYVYSNIAKLSE